MPDPALIAHADGTITMVWPDDRTSTLVVREVLTEMVEAHNRAIALGHEVERLVYRVAKWRAQCDILAAALCLYSPDGEVMRQHREFVRRVD